MRQSFKRAVIAGAAAGVLGLPQAQAHHSFAVHFLPDEIMTISGVVSEFRFRNPHGVVSLTVTGEDGAEEQWKVETNSPNILKRRGWSEGSIAAGDEITIEGYPARDGSNFMRIYRVSFADGRELIGQRPSAGEDEE